VAGCAGDAIGVHNRAESVQNQLGRCGGKEGLMSIEHDLSLDGARVSNVLGSRRRFIAASIGLGAAGIAGATSLAFSAESKPKEPAKDQPKPAEAEESPVSATEDLMREHGVLDRILLVYEEGLRRIRLKEDVAAGVFRDTASLVRKFVEDYHEKLEENFIFPAFEKRNQLSALTKSLRAQHAGGRDLTAAILANAADDRFGRQEARLELVRACESFIRLYRPHKSREDTVLFPALHFILKEQEMDKLGDQFEDEENRLFGDRGFEKTVEQVAGIEKLLGINDLDQFTPK
jgi:hemerythrin-like domain-containing protein